MNGDFTSNKNYYRKLIYWDNSLEPRRGTYPESGERYGKEGAPFPTLVKDWIDIQGEGPGFKTVTITMRSTVGLGYDGSETLMSLYRHSNSKPFHIYVIYETKKLFNKVFGFDLNVLSVLKQDFNIEYPPTFTFTLNCQGILLSAGRDFYVTGETLGLTRHDGSLHDCPEGSGFFRQV